MKRKKLTPRVRVPEKHVPMEPLVLETFDGPPYRDAIYLRNRPSAWNGNVRAVRYRVTVEEIVEPEAVAKRLHQLWLDANGYGAPGERNYHHWSPIQWEAKRHGVTLPSDEEMRAVKP